MPKKGFTLIAAIFIILGMTVLALTTVSLITADAGIATKNYQSLSAFYIANAGAEYYLKQFAAAPDWQTAATSETRSFNVGSFTVTTTDESAFAITFTVAGLVNDGETIYERRITQTLGKSGGWSDILGDYAIYWGGGSGSLARIGNNATITGNILVNSNLTIGNNVAISGDVYATGDINVGNNTTVSGTRESAATLPETFPSLESVAYAQQLAIAASQTGGSWVFGSATLSGTTYVNGVVVINNNAQISVNDSATIVVTGSMQIGNNVKLGNNLTLIVGGALAVGNNVQIGSNNIFYTAGSLALGNNFDMGIAAAGQGSVILSEGDVAFGNNGEYYGFILCEGEFEQSGNNFIFGGCIVTSDLDKIGNNSNLAANPDLVDYGSLVGLPQTGGTDTVTINNWQESYQ